MERFGISVELKNKPVLDPGFMPLLQFNRAFLKGAAKPVSTARRRWRMRIAITLTVW